MNAIVIRNLNKSYKNFSLKNINLEVPMGTIVGLVGENGAGKTTLINSILNITKPDKGEVEILGLNNNSKEYTEVKEHLGVVLDTLGIYERYDIHNVNELFKLAYKNWDSDVFFELLEKFEIYTGKKIKEFSTGMKKKLDLAISLSHNPDLMIFDEPTANLDPVSRDEVLDLILEFTRDDNKSVLISSHILSDLEKICDYICYIHKGEIVLFEEKDYLLEKYALLRLGHDEYKTIPKEAIVYEEFNKYGYELLVKAEYIPSHLPRQFTTLDSVIVKLIRSMKNENTPI